MDNLTVIWFLWRWLYFHSKMPPSTQEFILDFVYIFCLWYHEKKIPRLYCSLILSSHFKNKFKIIVSYLFQFCHRIFTLWDSMHEAGRCRTFNILVGFPHKITDSNHSRHFEADFFFHVFFFGVLNVIFLKSKNKLYLYTKHWLVPKPSKKRYSSPNTG